jgi:lipoprotein-anchoring transpeptidase ErfK/SrfK
MQVRTMRPSSQRRTVLSVIALTALTISMAHANVLINVDKNTQTMTVSVDGTPRYQFSVSTGRAGYGTPNGSYHPIRLERTWFSKEYYNSPMPHSIFFKGGYAIHGSYEISRLGGPASHGCVRLHPKNAATLFSLVKSEGIGATTIVVSGQNPSSTRPPEVARRTREYSQPVPAQGNYYPRGYDRNEQDYYRGWSRGGSYAPAPYQQYW